MPRAYADILQFRIELMDIEPPIWRRFQVPGNYTFWDLHVAIQDVMGWEDSHLHQFEVSHPITGEAVVISLPDEDGWSEQPILTSWEFQAREYFSRPGNDAVYVYDFGDDWRHLLHFEGALPVAKGVRYPTCLDGARACPPEDSGGPFGYAELIAGEPDRLDWLGDDFDPEAFEPLEIRFTNPKQRWKWAFGDEG